MGHCSEAHIPFRFDEYDLNDSLMCLFRQCKNLGDDVLVKYHSRDSFQVQYQSYIFDFTSDKTGNHFKNSNFSCSRESFQMNLVT